jgi:signal transduction histidine kinase
MIVINVADNGNGIAPDILADIFERGVSGDGGTGLGLAICKEAITSSGGTIDIKSEAGSGTTITFTLPMYNEDLEGLHERENPNG